MSSTNMMMVVAGTTFAAALIGCGGTVEKAKSNIPSTPQNTACTVNCETPPAVNDGICATNEACVEISTGEGVCATPAGGIPASAPACTGTDCAQGALCVQAQGDTTGHCVEVCELPPGPAEPTPEFTIGGYSGTLAIDGLGIRTYIYQGDEYYSTLAVYLDETATGATCTVTFDPAFAGFGVASSSTRTFATVAIDLGASIILEDGCGWDDDYITAELTGRTLVRGFTQARFPEDRPYLDLYYPESYTTIVGGATGYAMDANGVLDETIYVEPVGGVFVRGVYQW